MGNSLIGGNRGGPNRGPVREHTPDNLVGKKFLEQLLNTAGGFGKRRVLSQQGGNLSTNPTGFKTIGYGPTQYPVPQGQDSARDTAAYAEEARMRALQNSPANTPYGDSGQRAAQIMGMRPTDPSALAAMNSPAANVNQGMYGQSGDGVINGGDPTAVAGDPITTAGTDAFEGFAGEFAPGSLGEILGDPEQMVYEWLKFMGIKNPSDATLDTFNDMGKLAPYLMTLINPNLDLNDTSNDTTADLLNRISDYMNEQSKVGGRTPNSDDMLRNLVNSGSMRGDKGNALTELLTGGTADDQISAYAGYARAAIESLSPAAQNAVLARLNRWGREWMSRKNKDQKDDMTFGEYVDLKGGIFGVG